MSSILQVKEESKMPIIKKEFFAPSSDGIHTLSGAVYLPEGEKKGLFHVVHGMTEHIERYDRFMTDMAENGYVCFGYDHLGHGKTVKSDDELGFIASKDGWQLLAKDVGVFSDAVKREFDAENKLPYILMGHSMGSFVVRLASEGYAKPDKLIIMGTGGANPAAGMGLKLISLIKAAKGERHVSRLVYKIAFGSYNKRFGGGSKEDPSPWLSRDVEVRKKYYADKYCTFKFTVSAMGDLITLIKLTNDRKWYDSVPKIPMLLVSGEEDPVGNYGKGVKEVYGKLKERGVPVSVKLYSGARHEILNDETYEQTKSDITKFVENDII